MAFCAFCLVTCTPFPTVGKQWFSCFLSLTAYKNVQRNEFLWKDKDLLFVLTILCVYARGGYMHLAVNES